MKNSINFYLLVIYIVSLIIYNARLMYEIDKAPSAFLKQWGMTFLYFIGGFVPIVNSGVAILICYNWYNNRKENQK